MLEIIANAKVNLFLEITGKLSNGYHSVDTVMQSVSLFDVIKLDLLPSKSGIVLNCNDCDIPTDERNIAYKTAKAYIDYIQADCGVCIDITKQIPSQAGMGGGSADGAAVLVGLNRLCGDVLSLETLKEISAKLGADIPFCIDGGTQRLLGTGTELVERFNSPRLPIVIAKPMCGISTPSAYGLLDSMHNNFASHIPMDPTCLLENLRYLKSTANDLPMYNRFEEVLDTLCPESLAILHYLKSNGCNALLSGSGAAVFGIAESVAESNRIADSIKEEFTDYFVYVTETANSGCTFIN